MGGLTILRPSDHITAPDGLFTKHNPCCGMSTIRFADGTRLHTQKYITNYLSGRHYYQHCEQFLTFKLFETQHVRSHVSAQTPQDARNAGCMYRYAERQSHHCSKRSLCMFDRSVSCSPVKLRRIELEIVVVQRGPYQYDIHTHEL